MTRYETEDGLPGLALAEWESDLLSDVTMNDRDLRLAERLRARQRDAAVDVRASEGGVQVAAKGAVGLVRFSQFEIRVEPKMPGDHLQLFRMIEFAEGLSGLVQLAGAPRMRTAGTNLLDFIIELLSSATDRILSAGLRADYVEREDQLPALRGRLLPDRQLLERFGRYDRVLCRYDEHEHDIADNQLLALALAQGARTATLRNVRRRARGLAAVLEEVCDPGALDISPGREAFAYSRHNEHYRPAHALCWLVLQHVGLDEALSTGQASIRSFLVDMNRLFERFVERALALALAPLNISVTTQRSDSIFWRPDSRVRYARVRPDCLVHAGTLSARLPVDAKYKRYAERRVDVDDLTQVFLYAYAYRDPQAVHPPRAMLIHPSESPGDARQIPVEVRSVAERQVDAELTVVGVHIPTVLDEAETGSGSTLTALAELVVQRLGGEPTRSELGLRTLAADT